MQTKEIVITEIHTGEGPEAAKGALCFAHYEGRLEDGRVFDASKPKGQPFEFVVGSKKIIAGLSLGVMGMKAGGKRNVLIPSHLAYGDRQVGPLIAPHSNLIFEIEMLEVRPRE